MRCIQGCAKERRGCRWPLRVGCGVAVCKDGEAQFFVRPGSAHLQVNMHRAPRGRGPANPATTRGARKQLAFVSPAHGHLSHSLLDVTQQRVFLAPFTGALCISQLGTFTQPQALHSSSPKRKQAHLIWQTAFTTSCTHTTAVHHTHTHTSSQTQRAPKFCIPCLAVAFVTVLQWWPFVHPTFYHE